MKYIPKTRWMLLNAPWILLILIPNIFHLSIVNSFSYFKTIHSNNKQPITLKPLHLSKDVTIEPIPQVLCIGETLWDSLPNGLYLGGAPTNVAIHLSSLHTQTAILSCIGKDRLGDETIRRLEARGVHTYLIQRHEVYSTGLVVAIIDQKTGDASYEFDTPSSWDCLSFHESCTNMCAKVDAIVFGSICARLKDSTSIDALNKVRQIAKMDTLIFDVNLRPPWYTPQLVLSLARGGQTIHDCHEYPLALLKVNEDELNILEDWCHDYLLLPKSRDDYPSQRRFYGQALQKRMEYLAEQMNANRVCVTRGEKGAALFCKENSIFVEHDGFTTLDMDASNSDTVGAGDAFLAAMIRSLLLDKETPEKALLRGCALGGYVASCQGAVPDHKDAPAQIQQLISFST